ncbi:MAG: hypothetical protein CR959_01670 [Fusobacteriales bacterium]|nr:MAG: hypothetical protein CR959_01670 [Fusobacteriales bacterium]
MKEDIFLRYFYEDYERMFEIIKNHKNKRIIFKSEIEGNKYYIKKYVLKGRKVLSVKVGLKRDKASHYKFISNKLKKLRVNHVEPYYIKTITKSLLNIESILVTREEGTKTVEDFIMDFKEHQKIFKVFFDTFIFLCKNGIYCTDYNLSGMLVNEKNELLLIDFDSYKTKFYLSKKFKKRVIDGLINGYKAENYYSCKEFQEYCEKELKRVLEKLKWNF